MVTGEQRAARSHAYARKPALLAALASLPGAACLNLLPWLFGLWGTAPEQLRENYGAIFYLQTPALLLLEHSPLAPLWGWEGAGKAAQLAAEGGTFLARAGQLLALLVHWLPWALLLALVLSWRRPLAADGSGLAGQVERRRLLRALAYTELPWWALFLAAAPLKQVDWLNFATFVVALPAVKLIQVHAVLRAALVRRGSLTRTILAGLLAGAALLYWLPFLVLNEEFQRAEELRQERRPRRESGPSS